MTMPLVDVRVKERSGVPVAHLEGEIDIANVSDVRNRLLEILTNTAPGLIVDLTNVTYLDSRGVQLLLELSERLQVRQLRFRIVVPEHSMIRRVLLLTHVDSVVPIDAALDSALASIQTHS